MKNIVGAKVKAARALQQPRLTQAQLAAKLQLAGWNIDRVGIAKIEARIREVKDTEILKLAAALKVSPSWLLEEINENC